MEWSLSCLQLCVRRGSRFILKDVDFRVPTGAAWAITGPHATGKSTLLRVLAGVVAPSSGAVEVLQSRPRQWAQLRGRRSAYLAADQLLFGSSVKHYLARLAGLQEMTSAVALRAAAGVLSEFGLDSIANKNCRDLLVSETRCVGIAQAFLGEPEVVLLDEPTEGLDSSTIALLADALLRRKSHATIVLTDRAGGPIEALCDSTLQLCAGGVTVSESNVHLPGSV